jgi:peptide/nickel transport system substrate-binding protein
MKVVRKWYWISSAFLKKYAIGIIVGGLIGTIAVTNLPKIVEILPFKDKVYVGRVGAYTLADLPLDIQQKISRGLTKIDANGEVSLDISQTISTSDDATIYKVTLNPNAYWADGSRIISSEIDLSVSDVQITRESDEIIIFTLPEPFAPFPSVLSQPVMKRVITGKILKRTQVIGTGEYRIADIQTQNQRITKLTLKSDIKEIYYYFFPTEEEAVTAFKLGKVDSLENLSSPHLTDWPNVTLETINRPDRYIALFFNTTNPNLQDKSIRQMLNYATPKPDDVSRIISPVSQSSWVYNPQVKPYEYNLEIAQAMMARMKSNNPNLNLHFEITTTPAYSALAQEIALKWQDLGVDTNVKIVSFPDLTDYQVLLIGQQIPPDPDQYALWHSTQRTNITNYQNPKIDKLLEDGRQEKNKEERKRIYQDFQRFIVEDSPVAFISELPHYNLYRSVNGR